MSGKRVSVVTTTYNDVENLKKIINEVTKQDYDNLEHIIVDGGSTDGTLELLKKYQNKYKEMVKYISEKDNGIYDAINKGIKMSTGDIIGCCFDRYTNTHVISDMVDVIEREGTDGVHGNLYYMEGNKVVRYWRQGQGKIKMGWMPGHPTLYLKRTVYEKFGFYKTNYRISADYEFMVRILKDEQVRLSYIDRVLILMSHGGTSTNGLKAYWESLKEGHRALKENGIHFAWCVDFLRTLRVLKQFIKRK